MVSEVEFRATAVQKTEPKRFGTTFGMSDNERERKGLFRRPATATAHRQQAWPTQEAPFPFHSLRI